MTRFADDSLVRIAPLRENPRPASDPESFGATRPPSLAVLVAADKLTSLDGAYGICVRHTLELKVGGLTMANQQDRDATLRLQVQCVRRDLRGAGAQGEGAGLLVLQQRRFGKAVVAASSEVVLDARQGDAEREEAGPGAVSRANARPAAVRGEPRSARVGVSHADDGGEAPIRVLAAIISRGPDYLICQRPAHKRHGGLWEFPGGKLEPGETDVDAARRELREELGVRVSAVGAEQFIAHDDGSPFLIAFVPVEIDGEPTCIEHSALAWTPREALLSYALAPSDRRFVEWLATKHDRATTPPK